MPVYPVAYCASLSLYSPVNPLCLKVMCRALMKAHLKLAPLPAFCCLRAALISCHRVPATVVQFVLVTAPLIPVTPLALPSTQQWVYLCPLKIWVVVGRLTKKLQEGQSRSKIVLTPELPCVIASSESVKMYGVWLLYFIANSHGYAQWRFGKWLSTMVSRIEIWHRSK